MQKCIEKKQTWPQKMGKTWGALSVLSGERAAQQTLSGACAGALSGAWGHLCPFYFKKSYSVARDCG